MPGSGTEQLVLACECGSTLKLSTLNLLELEDFQLMWQARHPEVGLIKGHGRVTPTEARRIRDTTKKRAAWLRKGAKVQ